MNIKNTSILFLLCFLNNFCIYISATEDKTSVAFSVTRITKDSISEKKNNIIYAKKLFKNNKTEEALKLFLKIAEDSKNRNNEEEQKEIYHQISLIFKKIKHFEKSIEYSKKSLTYAKSTQDTLFEIDETLNLCSLYYNLYRQDKKNNKSSLDSVILYSQKAAIPLSINPKKYDKQRATYLNSIAVIDFENKNYDSAVRKIKQALQINKKLNDTIKQVGCLNILASNFLNIKNYTEASKYYEQALKLLENNNSDRKLDLSKIIYFNLAYTYYVTKNYKAYEYLDSYNRIADSLRNAEFDAIITEIEAKHNVDIVKQNAAKKQLIQLQEKKRFQTFTIALGICLFILILVFWIYSLNTKLKHENKDLLIEKTRLMKEKQIEHMEAQTRIKILNATLDGKEAERKQIAETLHDSVSALLSAANLHLQAIKTKHTGQAPLEIDKTQNIIDEASGKIRNLSHELISSVLIKFGLSYAIHDFCEKYSNSQLEISCSTENLQRYDQSFEIRTNNIIEELVNNLIKHSKASEGHVSAMEYKKNLYVEIQDNGVGFDTSKKIESNGIGIHQIDARIKMMKGDFKIHSILGEGTTIEFMVPIHYKSSA